jgi:hypothetical protein
MSETLVQDTLVRMVVPMRREFGAALDVARMRRDLPYAHMVVAHALRSRDVRLRGYAKLIDKHVLRMGELPPAEPDDADAAAAAAEVAAAVLRRRAQTAARALLDSVGPAGEPLAMRIEGAADAAALDAALKAAQVFVAQLRGQAASRAYGERLGATSVAA